MGGAFPLPTLGPWAGLGMGRIETFGLGDTRDLLFYTQKDICSAKKKAFVLKTGLALKTKSGHKVIDLLELSSQARNIFGKEYNFVL